MVDQIEYSQDRSFNVGIALETSIEAAMIYNDLIFAQKVFGEGYFYRSDEQMILRFPMISKNTIRRHVDKLIEAGYISTVVKKVNGVPTRNYQIEQFLLPKMGKSMEIPKMGKSIYKDKVIKKETKRANALHSDSSTTSKEESNPLTFGADELTQSSAVVKPTSQANPVMNLLNEVIIIINPREKPTDERKRMLHARLRNYTVKEIIATAHVLAASEWHKENKQMSIDNLLAPSKFGRLYAKIPTNTPQSTGETKEQREARYDREEQEQRERNDRMLKVIENSVEEGKNNGTNETDSTS